MSCSKKYLLQESNFPEEVAPPKKASLALDYSYSEEVADLKRCLLWRSRLFEDVAALKKLLNILKVVSSFEN